MPYVSGGTDIVLMAIRESTVCPCDATSALTISWGLIFLHRAEFEKRNRAKASKELAAIRRSTSV